MEFNIPHSIFTGDADNAARRPFPRTTARRVLAFARPYKRQLTGFIITIFLTAFLSLVPPILFREIIDGAIADGNRTQLNILAGIIVAAAIGEALLSFVERWWSSRIGEGLIFDLRVRLFDHVQRLPISFFTRVQTGSLISRMNNDVIGAQRAFTGTLGDVLSNTIIFCTTLAAMLVLEWRLTLLAMVLLPVFILPSRRVGRALAGLARRQMNQNAEMNAQMTERLGVSGALLVKLFGSHRRERSDFSTKAAKVRDTGIRTAMYGRTFAIGLGLVASLGIASIYWIGGHLAVGGGVTIGTLAALGLLVARIYGPIISLTSARVDIMTALVSFERVFEVQDIPNTIVDREEAAELGGPAGRIELRDVSFAYGDDGAALPSLEIFAETPSPSPSDSDSDSDSSPQSQSQSQSPPQSSSQSPNHRFVLSDISLTIQPGQTVALVGPSGSGKSTLVSLICRLYDVERGAVLIDGVDVRDLTSRSLRDAIGMVHQDPHLFHDTIRANLLYARPKASHDEVTAAARAAQIHDKIASLPNGYDTIVGERGYRLSGGEKQRLSVARMILKNPQIVILDEATSHLDSENEEALQAALGEALQNRTAIIIAHRLTTIMSADLIFVLDEGQIRETGTHNGLLTQNGLYADLYNTMLKEESAGGGADNSADSGGTIN